MQGIGCGGEINSYDDDHDIRESTGLFIWESWGRNPTGPSTLLPYLMQASQNCRLPDSQFINPRVLLSGPLGSVNASRFSQYPAPLQALVVNELAEYRYRLDQVL